MGSRKSEVGSGKREVGSFSCLGWVKNGKLEKQVFYDLSWLFLISRFKSKNVQSPKHWGISKKAI